MSGFLCWLGFHTWAYEFGVRGGGPMQERRCYRCGVRQAPYDLLERRQVEGSNFERAA